MSNVIQFLEALGRDSALGTGSPAAYAQAVRELDIDDALRDALLHKDQETLSRLLGAQHNVMLILAPAEDEPLQDDRPDDGEEEIRATGTRS